ncbi:MAG: AAA family ATPase [Pseudomonadota bacterium]
MKSIGLRVRDADFEAERVQHRSTTDATTLADVSAAARRQFFPLALCTFLGFTGGLVHHATTPKQYYTSATVLVDERRSDLEEEITASIPFLRNDTSLLNEIQVLKSLQLATEVVRRLELQENDTFLYPPSSLARSIVSGAISRVKNLVGIDQQVTDVAPADPAQLEAFQLLNASSKLQGDIRVERIGLSFSIDISYIGHDPKLAADIVNTYAETYLEDRLNANLESTERTTEWMRTRLEELEQSSADVLARASALRQSDPTKVVELRELAQRAANLDALYQTISARYEQVSIQGSFPVSNGRILTQSIVPKSAALPKLWQTLAVVTLMGIMLGFAWAMWRESRERSFRVSKDVHDYTGRAFLGHLPQINLKDFDGAQPQEIKEIMLRAETDKPNKTLDPKASHSGASQTEFDWRKAKTLPARLFWSVWMPQSMFSETLRNIHTTVGMGKSDGKHMVIAVTSMLSGEGKTTLAVNYANMLAKSGARVVLIDMDLHGFNLSDALNVPAGPGIFEVLRGETPLPDAVQVLDYTGLNILPSGPTRQKSAAGDVVYQQNMQALISELRKDYDYVILDMPPLGKVSDGKAMIAHLDKIILVCEWGKTPRSLITRYLAHEPEIAQKVVGIVLNKVNVRKLLKYARPGWPESYLETDLKPE